MIEMFWAMTTIDFGDERCFEVELFYKQTRREFEHS